MYSDYLNLKLVTLSHYCRALPGLPSLLALPKSKQKASAKFRRRAPVRRERLKNENVFELI